MRLGRRCKLARRRLNGPKAKSALSPVYPTLRTLVGVAGRSLSCHNRTLAPQQKHHYSMTTSVRTRIDGEMPAPARCA
jgi:hypothetical protein